MYSPESGSSVILGTQKETPNSVSLRLRRHILSSDIASGILKNGLHLDADACRNNRIVVSLRKRDYRYLIYKSKRTENDNDFSEIIQNKLQDLRHCTVGQIGITFTNRK